MGRLTPSGIPYRWNTYAHFGAYHFVPQPLTRTVIIYNTVTTQPPGAYAPKSQSHNLQTCSAGRHIKLGAHLLEC